MKSIVVLGIILISVRSTLVPSFLWSFDIPVTSEKGDSASSIFLNQDSTFLLVVGLTWGNINSTQFSREQSHDDSDAFILAYSVFPDAPTSLPEIRWCKQFGSTGFDDEAVSVTIDNDDNVYVAGYIHEDSTAEKRGLLIKYTSEGEEIWKINQGVEIRTLKLLQYSSSGNVSTNATLESRESSGNASTNTTLESRENNNCTSLPGVSNSSNESIIGDCINNTIIPSWTSTPLPAYSQASGSGYIYATVLDENENCHLTKIGFLDGEVMWSSHFRDDFFPRDLTAITSSSKILSAGDLEVDSGTYYTTNLTVLGYNSTGSFLWQTSYGAQMDTDTKVYSIRETVQYLNQSLQSLVYLAGYTTGDFGSVSRGGRDMFLCCLAETKLASTGDKSHYVLQYVDQFGSEFDEMLVGLQLSQKGDIYAVGQAVSADSSGMSCTPIGFDGGGTDIHLFKYSQNKEKGQLWCVYFGSMYEDMGKGLAINQNASLLYVLGTLSSEGQKYTSITAVCENCTLPSNNPSSSTMQPSLTGSLTRSSNTSLIPTKSSTVQNTSAVPSTLPPTIQSTQQPSAYISSLIFPTISPSGISTVVPSAGQAQSVNQTVLPTSSEELEESSPTLGPAAATSSHIDKNTTMSPSAYVHNQSLETNSTQAISIQNISVTSIPQRNSSPSSIFSGLENDLVILWVCIISLCLAVGVYFCTRFWPKPGGIRLGQLHHGGPSQHSMVQDDSRGISPVGGERHSVSFKKECDELKSEEERSSPAPPKLLDALKMKKQEEEVKELEMQFHELQQKQNFRLGDEDDGLGKQQDLV